MLVATLQYQAGLQVRDLLDAFLEGGSLEFGTWIAARLFQFADDVLHGGRTEPIVRVIDHLERAQKRAVTDDLTDVAAAFLQDALNHRVGLRMHRRGVQWRAATHHAEKPGGLLVGLLTESRHLLELLTICECAVLVTELNDVLGDRAGQAGDARQQCR